MEIILSQDIPKLGKIGEVVKVKDGYARNFLFPKKLAYAATQVNLRKIEREKKSRQDKYEQEKQEAQSLADKLNKISCTVNVEVNDLDKLYGAVSVSDIVKALEVEGHHAVNYELVSSFLKKIEENPRC